MKLRGGYGKFYGSPYSKGVLLLFGHGARASHLSSLLVPDSHFFGAAGTKKGGSQRKVGSWEHADWLVALAHCEKVPAAAYLSL